MTCESGHSRFLVATLLGMTRGPRNTVNRCWSHPIRISRNLEWVFRESCGSAGAGPGICGNRK
jgi:hypothetical protein